MKKNYLVLMIGITFLFSTFEIFAAGTWSMTGSMNTVRDSHVATLLPNGKVLVAGGENTFNAGNIGAEIYNPTTNTWSATGSMNIGRENPGVVLLPNGQILVAGGYNDNGRRPNYLSSAEIYNPDVGSWTTTGSMHVASESLSATLLPNGRALVAGGHINYGNTPLSRAELYNPATGTWTVTGSLNIARTAHTATLLPNGKVLVAGGVISSGGHTTSSAEIYDPTTGKWTLAGSMNIARAGTATLLPNGKVLVAGGSMSTVTEIYDPTTDIWTTTGPLNIARDNHTATLLSNNKILITGGNSGNSYIASTEIYDPATGTWAIGSMNIARFRHRATLLSDGKILVTGGRKNINDFLNSAELYDPGVAPPIVSAITKAGIEDAELTFATSDFTNHFSDPSSGSLTKVKIIDLPAHGTLKLSETDVTVNQEIPVANLNNLKFIPEANWNGTTSFNWNGSNGTEYAVSPANVNITIEAAEDRPILGMVTKTGTEGNTITFSASDFSNSFIDPDGYGLKKIKITSLSDCYGSLKLLNEEVKEGDEILINYLENLTFVPDPNWKGGTVTFNWNGSNGKLYAIRDGEVSITITDNSWWKPWIGGGAIGAATAIGTGYFTYKVNKYCHHHNNNDALLQEVDTEMLEAMSRSE